MVQRALKVLQIETINRCNASCHFCMVPKQKVRREMIDFGLFEKIINDCIELPPSEIMPFLNGEPFLDPDLSTRIRLINERLPRTKVSLYTNAFAADKDKVEALNGLNINYFNFSLNATSNKTRQNLMGIPLDKTIENIKMLRSSFPSTNMTGSIIIDRGYSAIKELEEFNDFCFSIGITPIRFLSSNYMGNLRPAYNTDDYCMRLDGHMTILSTGKVCLCCMDALGEKIMGDITKNSLKEIWNNEEFLRYYTLNKQGKKNELFPCLKCTGV